MDSIIVCEICGKSVSGGHFVEQIGNDSFLTCAECHTKIAELSSSDFNMQNQAMKHLFSCFNANTLSPHAKPFVYKSLGITDEQIAKANEKEKQGNIIANKPYPVLAEIVGVRTAENGGNGLIINSTNYSLVVYYSNGKVDLIEGGAKDIQPYLQYIQPKCNPLTLDKIQRCIIEAISSENTKMQAEITKLHKDIDKLHADFCTTQDVIKDIAGLLQPIPDIKGKSRHEAMYILNSNNLVYQEDDQINERLTGTVVQATRDREKHNTIHVKIRYDLPDVIGNDINDAKRFLKNMGFFCTVKAVHSLSNDSRNKVIDVVYSDGAKIELVVALSETDTFLEELDSATSIVQLQQNWMQHSLAESHPKTNSLIEEHANAEKEYGRSLNIGIIKLEIKHTFDEEEHNAIV